MSTNGTELFTFQMVFFDAPCNRPLIKTQFPILMHYTALSLNSIGDQQKVPHQNTKPNSNVWKICESTNILMIIPKIMCILKSQVQITKETTNVSRSYQKTRAPTKNSPNCSKKRDLPTFLSGKFMFFNNEATTALLSIMMPPTLG